jgi:hypothetical protein
MSTRARAEVAAAIATGILHFLAVGLLGLRGAFIAVALLAWSTYVVVRIRGDGSVVRVWGLSSQGLLPTWRAAGALALAALLGMAFVAAQRRSLRLDPHMVPLLVAYPAWGVFQQLLVQGMFVSNVVSVSSRRLPVPAAIGAAGLLFGCVHLPDPISTTATALMGGAFAAIFVRHRNIWPLGLLHGLLGVPFFFWILQRDPWLELLESIGLS